MAEPAELVLFGRQRRTGSNPAVGDDVDAAWQEAHERGCAESLRLEFADSLERILAEHWRKRNFMKLLDARRWS